MNQARADIYKRNIEGLPLHRFLGLKIENIGEGESTVTIPVDSHTVNPAGTLHGGVVYMVSDVAAFAAIGPVLGEDEFAVTIDVQTSVYRGAADGQVVFRARVTSRTKKFAFMNVEVINGSGKLLAETRVTKAILNTVPEPFRA